MITKIVQKYSKISEIGPLPNGPVFCDLGSGIGKTLIAASLLFNFSSCHGIELLEALHRGAEWVLESYHALVSTWHEVQSLHCLTLSELFGVRTVGIRNKENARQTSRYEMNTSK